MIKDVIPDYPLFGESSKQYAEWHKSRFDVLPDEADFRQWRRVTFPNILKLPLTNFEIPTPN